jgi:hypothetical protein
MSLDEADQEHLLPSGVGVQGNGPDAGVSGWSQWGNGVQGLSDKVGVFGQGGELAGHFVGGVSVEGDLNVTGRLLIDGADVAEALRELWDQVNALRD